MDIQEDLRFICASIDANLRYAEGKHAAFVAFNGVATFGAFGIARNLTLDGGGQSVRALLSVAICLLVCAIITGIYSFVPIIIRKVEIGGDLASDNALFFEHVKAHSPESYERLLCEKYQVLPESITPLDRCVISQIIVNARLASRKFALFKRVAFFDLAAVAFVLSGAVLGLVFR